MPLQMYDALQEEASCKLKALNQATLWQLNPEMALVWANHAKPVVDSDSHQACAEEGGM